MKHACLMKQSKRGLRHVCAFRVNPINQMIVCEVNVKLIVQDPHESLLNIVIWYL